MSKKQADYSAFLRDLADGMIETANEPFTCIAERDDCIECASGLKKAADAYDAMLAALEKLSMWAERLRASGDAGFWDWEEGDCYSEAQAALALAKPVMGKADAGECE